MEDPEKLYKRLEEILSDVSKTNNYVLRQAKELEMVLYSLQIEEPKLSRPNGIGPITDRLRVIILGIDKTVYNLVEGERKELRDIMSKLPESMGIEKK